MAAGGGADGMARDMEVIPAERSCRGFNDPGIAVVAVVFMVVVMLMSPVLSAGVDWAGMGANGSFWTEKSSRLDEAAGLGCDNDIVVCVAAVVGG